MLSNANPECCELLRCWQEVLGVAATQRCVLGVSLCCSVVLEVSLGPKGDRCQEEARVFRVVLFLR